MYKVGFPFWKVVARAGVPVSFRVDVLHDVKAGVYIATSPNLSGLVVETRFLDDLIQETNDAVEMLMEDYIHDAACIPEPLFHFGRNGIPA